MESTPLEFEVDGVGSYRRKERWEYRGLRGIGYTSSKNIFG
jgi:hypothetical protein